MLMATLTEGLVLTKDQERYVARLMRHNWLYMLVDSHQEYRKGRDQEAALYAIATRRGGQYQVLYDRAELHLRRFTRYRQVKHTFAPC